jgi:hypothetical protein
MALTMARLGQGGEAPGLRAAVSDGKSWCAYHRRIVFEPTRPGRIR